MNTLEHTIGNTPLVKLQRMGPDNGSEIWVKLEGNNPAGSVKDRAALSMIVQAEKRGEIKPGDVLIEATSGNTRIALAMIAALKGYRMKLLMPDNMSQERRAAMRAYGAELILVTKEQGMEGARDLALEMLSAVKVNCWISSTTRTTRTRTTPPPARKSGSKPTGVSPFCLQHGHHRHHYRGIAFSARAGKSRHHRWPPAGRGSSIPGIRRWPAEYMPGIFNAQRWTRCWIFTSARRKIPCVSWPCAKVSLCGVSSGGAVAGAIRVAQANPGAVVVAIICDRGDRNLSTGVFGEESYSQGAGI